MQYSRIFINLYRLQVPFHNNILRCVFDKTYNKPVFKKYAANVSVRNMSQKSITSFFKRTPKKIAAEDEICSHDERVKRSRSSSSEQKSEKTPQSSPSPVKKRKIKRACIESSDSEPETIKSKGDVKSEIKNGNKEVEAETQIVQNGTKLVEIKKEIVTPKRKSPRKSQTNTKADNEKEKVPLKTNVKSEKPSPKAPRVYKKKKVKENVEEGNEKENLNKEKNEDAEDGNKQLKKENPERDVKEAESKTVDKEQSLENANIKSPKEEKSKDKKVAEEDYNPSKSKYHPVDDACWKKGQETPYLALAKTLELIEDTSARLKMVEILSNYFRSVIALTPEDLLPSVYLCLNQLAPAYHNLELGIAETYLMKAVGTSTGQTLSQVKAAVQKCGDLGKAAEAARQKQRVMFPAPSLTTRKVYRALREVAACSGKASVDKKIAKIQTLYVACRQSEARYLIRSLEGKLRVGLAEQSLLQALALACAKTPPGDSTTLDMSLKVPADDFKARVDKLALIIKTTYCECPNYDMIIPVLLQHGVEELPQHCRLTPGIPLKPMLAHPTKGVSEVFDRFEGEEFTCEWKYDGERAQIHVPGEDKPNLAQASIFSRNQENNTTKYPDILERLPLLLKDTVHSCVLDCEAVAYDTETKQILPFQVLSTRKRKDVEQNQIKVQVCVFVFDLLFLNGRALVREPLYERRQLLKEHFNEVEGQWQFAAGRDCKNTEEVEILLDEAIKGSCEGLMVKALRGAKASYDIARRSRNWLKLKKDYLEGVGDTVDAVVIGGYRGRGKRAAGYGGFLLACYDPASEHYQSLCKIGTGFSDDDLKTLSAQLDKHLIDAPKNYYSFDSAHAPDAWFSAAAVWEVRCADLSLSPAHRAAIGLVEADKGISLRFPRFVRVREDKSPELATSAQQIAELYLSQDQVKNSATKHVDHDDFY